MPKTIKVTLSKPITSHKGLVSEVELREPTCEEFFDFGEPRMAVWSQEQVGIINTKNVEMKQIDNNLVIKKYLFKCVIEPDYLLVSAQCSLADAVRIKEAFLGFFDLALAAASTTAATFSSSTSDSAPPLTAGS